MRASRLLTIMMLLQTRGRMSAEALAEELEVSVRTVYRDSMAVTEYREFAGRTHFMIGQPGWEEVADQVIDWARGQQLMRAREQRRIAREFQSRHVD